MSCKVIVIIAFLGLTLAQPTQKYELAKPHKLRGKAGNKVGIYNGSSTTIKDHPYVVSLVVGGELYCGGAILSEDWIITDADCTYDLITYQITVVAGSRDGFYGSSHKVKAVITHPNWDPDRYYYAYALLQTKTKFKWSKKVSNITLPNKRLSTNSKVVVVGYGDTAPDYVDGVTDRTILQGTLKMQSNATCQKFYDDYGWNESELCAYNKGKVTVCTGDYGDPIVNGGVLYGTTWGGLNYNWCTSDAYPTVMGDIYLVKDWIQKYTGAQIAQN